MKKILGLILISIVILSSTHSVHAQQYYTVEEVLKYFFPKSEKVDFQKFVLSSEQKQKIESELKIKDLRPEWTVYKATTKNSVNGYAILDNVIGRDLPITYAVHISPDGQVVEVEIMIYRESHGGQVKNKGYRKQFVGKSALDPLQMGRDIQHVSGATISSRNIAAGVKRVLAVWNVLF